MLLNTFHSVDLVLFDWLLETTAITARLKKQCTTVEMEILQHRWVPCDWWERFVCLNKISMPVLRREILMRGDGVPYWFARTMIPEPTYLHDPAFFDRLQHEPLSALIYNESRVTRTIHSYGIDPQHLEYHWLQPTWRRQGPLSLRLSTFHLDAVVAFYLVEIFLTS